MTDTAIRDKIQDALNQCGNSGDFVAAAGDLLKALEYESDRRPDHNGDARQFIATFRAPHKNTHSEKRFVDAVASVRIVFQFAESEISRNLFAGQKFDQGMIKSFLFFAVILRGEKYGRHQYAEFTREINKRFAMPAVVLFLCRRNDAARLTLAFAGRRPSISDSSRQVLQKISLLREIKCDKTHQGHLRILEQLTFSRRLQWMTDNKLEENFDGLLAAWLDELDAEALNKRFYQDLLRWFNATVQIIKIPAADKKQLGKEAFVIRLINRVLFIWFLKEKGLVEPKLFIAEQIGGVLKDYTPTNGDSYYRAVLQNLFFATLNTKTDDRQFRRDDSNTKAYDEQHRDFTLRRYAKLIAQPKVLTTWLDKTPFVNGGLFDCLDGHKSKSQGGGGRVDCFSDNPTHQKMLSIPNRVFFGEKEGGSGLFDILNKYKFTVEENTPIEQEVALDPELLGKTFENLLIYIDRKETGSYYTPRPIVEFMVRESLLAYFVRAIGANDADQKRLRALLSAEVDYENLPAKQKLTKDKIKSFIDAASDLKLLDPAVGSGAFPMGALMVLTMALKRIDPKNAYLREREMRRANGFEDSRIRTEARQVVEEVFSPQNEHNHYGRKLSLIRDCIYGVDIQPMAVQICRLRFFISLAIEQKTDYKKPNFGIRPLPNLETKIIAADTLVKIQPADLFRSSVRDLENELMDTRRDFFTANDRTTKNKCRKKDEVLRQKIKETLCSKNYPAGDGNKISSWDLYDQTTTADWFDPAWMFGVHDGFDVVLGNPPYVRHESIERDYKRTLLESYNPAAIATSDLYVYFYARGWELLKPGGIKTLICSNSWLDVAYGKRLQNFLLKNAHLKVIYNSEIERQFSTAAINTIISVIEKRDKISAKDKTRFINFLSPMEDIMEGAGEQQELVKTRAELSTQSKWGGVYLRAPDIYHHLMNKYADKFVRLGHIADVKRGITTGANEFFYLDEERAQMWNIEDEFLRPIIKSPRECKGMVIDPRRLKFNVFSCSLDRESMYNMAALQYIEWGEGQGFDRRPSCRSRPRWWDFGMHDAPPLIVNYLFHKVMRFFIPQSEIYASDNFQKIYCHNKILWQICAAANSSVCQLFANVSGRVNFGDGLMKVQTYEMSQLGVVYPKFLSAKECKKIMQQKSMFDWDSDERKKLDGLIFDAIGLTTTERDAVYEETIRLIEKRLNRAANVPGND